MLAISNILVLVFLLWAFNIGMLVGLWIGR
jgi:hypothetical protein